MTSLLEASDIHVSYGKVEAVRGVSLKVAVGEIATIIGANGAGKTSLLYALIGALPGKASVSFQGQEIGAWSIEARTQAGISLVPERRELFSTMTVEENLELGGFARRTDAHASRKQLDWVCGLFPRLAERKTQRAGTLSGGEQQMLALGRALMSRPKLLMLDEPSLGLAPIIVRDIFKVVTLLCREGLSVLVVEQNARLALSTAHYAYVMEGGEFVREGAAATLLHDPDVIASYLGRKGGAERHDEL